MLYWTLAMLFGFPAWGALLLHLWARHLRPGLIPASEIERLADSLIARHGAGAADFAAMERDRSWRESDMAAEGRWRRVCRALRRRPAERP